MEFDLKETIRLIKGGLLDHQATWQGYFETEPPWQKTVGLLTLPLILINVLLSVLIASVIGGGYIYGTSFLGALISGLLMSAIGMALAAFVLGFVAGLMGGQNSFARGLAAISLAAIPGAIAGIVGALIPFVGVLITLAGAILSLVFLYQILPLALGVPEEKRVLHFIGSLILLFVLNLIVGGVLGLGGMGGSVPSYSGSGSSSGSGTSGSGFLGEMQRQGELMEAANADRYEPPANGKISAGQMRAYVKVKEKTRAAHERYAEKVKKLEQEMEDKENPSIADLSKMYSGIGGALGANNAEMEIVKTGGGNWAEHQWIGNALRTATIQQGDGSDALRHNFALWEQYRDQLEE